MTVIRLETEVNAPPQEVFDAARDLDIHLSSMRHYRERAVAGRTSGLIGLNETVTWRALHFGLPLRLTVRIAELDPPRRFRDVQVRGPFAHMEHEHVFEPTAEGTHMIDVFDYAVPAGSLGRLVDRLAVRRKMQRLVEERVLAVKRAAEERTAS